MSSSQSKITSATCPKCKQGFKFERVPKMASVVCPHCDAQIRLTRKKSKSKSTKQSAVDPPVKDEPQARKQHPKSKTPDAGEAEQPRDDFSKIDVARKQQQVSFDGLEIGGSDDDDSELTEQDPIEEAGDVVNIRTGRERKQVDLSNLTIDDEESAGPNLDALHELPPQRRSVSLPEANRSSDDEIVSVGQTKTAASNIDQPEPDEEARDSESDLLPPKFLVSDIEADDNAVVLPAAGGGFQVVDKTEVHVMHEGRAVKLVSLSPEELKRVRLIENLIALLIAAIMLAIAAWLVL